MLSSTCYKQRNEQQVDRQKQQRNRQNSSNSSMSEEHHALSLDGVVENILRFLPQGHRLGCCSRVCTRWHAAAVAVTAEAGLLLADCGPPAEAWLQKHCSNLQALVLRTGSLCGSGDTSSIAGLHQVTRLELNSVTSKPALLRGIGNSMKVCLITKAVLL